jgi:hypothetical protein
LRELLFFPQRLQPIPDKHVKLPPHPATSSLQETLGANSFAASHDSHFLQTMGSYGVIFPLLDGHEGAAAHLPRFRAHPA